MSAGADRRCSCSPRRWSPAAARSRRAAAATPSRSTLALDFYVNPDHAGIYTALDRGYFDEAGLEVEPQVPSDPSAPIRQVAAGRADLAISYEPEVLLARDQGLPVVAVAALVSRPLTSLISLPEARDRATRRPRGQDGRDRRDPLPGRLPRRDPRRGAGCRPDDVEPGRRRPQPAAARCSRAAPTRCSAASSTSRASTSPSAAATRGWSRSTGSGSRPTTSSSWSPTPTGSPRTRRRSACSSPRSSAAREAAVRDPAAATEAILEAGDGLDPKLTRAEIDRTLPLLLPDEQGAAVRLHERARVGGVRRLLRRPRPDLHPPGAARAAHQRAAAPGAVRSSASGGVATWCPERRCRGRRSALGHASRAVGARAAALATPGEVPERCDCRVEHGALRRSTQQLLHLLSLCHPVQGLPRSAVELGGDLV